MALNSASYFNSKAAPIPQLAGRFNKFTADSSPKYPLGFKVETSDGCVYRYAQFGADTNRGVLVATDLSETSIADTDNSILAPASTVSLTDGAVGQRFVEITAAGITANQYAGGKFVVTDDAGEGYTYDIKGNTATGNPASGTFRLELAQPLQVALTAASDYSIVSNLYNDVETATAATDNTVVGVSCANMTTASAAFGWIQTKGVVAILQDAKVPTVGQVMCLSHLTAGAVGPLGGTSTTATDYGLYPIVGICVDPGDSTGATVCKINLE
jgi:hypothetical protein